MKQLVRKLAVLGLVSGVAMFAGCSRSRMKYGPENVPPSDQVGASGQTADVQPNQDTYDTTAYGGSGSAGMTDQYESVDNPGPDDVGETGTGGSGKKKAMDAGTMMMMDAGTMTMDSGMMNDAGMAHHPMMDGGMMMKHEHTMKTETKTEKTEKTDAVTPKTK